MDDAKRDDLIRKQREEIESLRGALADKLGANERNLNELKKSVEGMPELEQMRKTATDLEKAVASIAPIIQALQKIDPNVLKELMKK